MPIEVITGSEEWNRLVLGYDPFEGDYGDGSERTLCDEIRIVKRGGKCRECDQAIVRGTFARVIKKADSDGFYGGRICQECCNCMAEITAYMESPIEDDEEINEENDPYEKLNARMALRFNKETADSS